MDGGRRARLDASPLVRKDVELVRVMIRCSVVGRAIPTGLAADPVTWFARPIGLNRMFCPECKQIHAWSKSDAFLESPGGGPSLHRPAVHYGFARVRTATLAIRS
jgi:hypothetical protein